MTGDNRPRVHKAVSGDRQRSSKANRHVAAGVVDPTNRGVPRRNGLQAPDPRRSVKDPIDVVGPNTRSTVGVAHSARVIGVRECECGRDGSRRGRENL